jgi:2'-5' RNA ligase
MYTKFNPTHIKPFNTLAYLSTSMPPIRSFIALELTEEIRKQLERIISKLRTPQNQPIRWVAVQNIHLTLKFLGYVSEQQIPNIKSMLIEITRSAKSFNFGISRCGAFPNILRPRVIWVGIDANDELMRLQKSVEDKSAELGFPSDERSFSPHLTLGRVSQSATTDEVQKIGTQLKQLQVGNLGIVTVDSIQLYQSDLFSTGPVYTRLISIKLSS